MRLLGRYAVVRDEPLWIAASLAGFAAIFATVPIALVAYLLSRVLRGTLGRPQLAFSIAVFLVAIALRIVVASAAGRRVRDVLSRRAERLRVAVIERLRRVPARELARVDAGGTVAAVTTGLDEAIALFGDAFDALFGGVLTALLTLTVLAIVDWRIALVSLAFLPITAGYLWRSRKSSSRAMPRLLRARAEGSSRFFEYVESVALLRAFGRTTERARRLAWALRELQIKAFETAIAPISFGVLALFFIEFGFAIALMVGTNLGATAGVAGARYLLALVIALAYFQTLFDALDGYLRLRDAGSNVREIERLLELDTVDAGSTDAPEGRELVIDRVSFAYDRGPVLHDISYRFPLGVTAIVGRSGAGKSALAGIIAGLWDPSDGNVFIGGVDLWKLSADARARTIALVFQDVYLTEDTIAKNIAAGRPGASDEDVRSAARTANCDEFVARLPEGYATVVRAGGTNLSLGERQRIAIARALLSHAPIMVFDECTASLDAATERAVHRAIETLAHHRTIVLITHRLGTVRHARHIVVLANGVVSETGTHESLLSGNGEYSRLWAAYERTRHWRAAAV